MPRRVAALLAAGLILLPACTNGSSKPVFHPTFRGAACPSDVEILLVVTHSCGYLTVVENRSRPSGPTLRLFVLKVEPPSAPPRADPALIVGDDLGAVPDYGGHQPTAQRVDRIVYVLDPRGTGHSQPGLACPEMDPVSKQGLSAPTADPGLRQGFLAAVAACRARLAGQDLDPADFGLEQMAADIEDLRRTLGIGSWNLASYGSTSRIVLEAMREDAPHIRAVWLDSPEFPQLDEPTAAPVGTAMALQTLFDTCRADAACEKNHPDLPGVWALAVAGLAAHPVTARAADGRDVLVDAGAFVRSVRALLAGHGQGPGNVIATIAAAALGRITDFAAFKLVDGGTLCTGYRLGCTAGFSVGTYLSVLCRDEAPFVDRSTLQQADGRLPGLAQAFGAHPYLAACSVWDVRPAAAAVHAPVTAAVPTLVLPGQFDPFSPPELARQLSASLPKSFLLEIPGASHNSLGYSDCPITIRNAWLANPSSPPQETACLAQLKTQFS